MEARAQQAYLGKIKALEDSLQQTSEKLQALQRQRGAGRAIGRQRAALQLLAIAVLEVVAGAGEEGVARVGHRH